MHKSFWTQVVASALIIGSLGPVGWAEQAGQAARPAGGFTSILERRVGLTPEQRDSVRGLLAAQRQKSQALRVETDNKIRALLNSEQQKKFDQVIAEQKANRFKRSRP